MKGQVVPNLDTSHLDAQFMDDDGFVRLLPAKAWQELDRDLLRVWCHRRSRYGIVTEELVEWLRGHVVPGHTVELGAGMGDLGHHLGIRMTDSFAQQRPELQLTYALMGQPVTAPPACVEHCDAEAALGRFNPQVAIASWLTQKFEDGDEELGTSSSVYGPDERRIIRAVETYIHIGNFGVHGDKRALKLAHQVFQFPWLVSRAADPGKNFIAVWSRSKG